MNWLEGGKKQNFPTFLEQEHSTDGKRGTCFSTSVVNATLGFGLVTNKEAIEAHHRINQAMGEALVWSFSGHLLLDFGNEDIVANILEQSLPITVGRRRCFREYKSYTDLSVDITQRIRTYVVLDSIDSHCYAAIPYGDKAGFIDPNEPLATLMNFDDIGFSRYFHGDRSGLTLTVPLIPIPRRSYW